MVNNKGMSKYMSKTTSDCEKCLKETKQVMARVTEKKPVLKQVASNATRAVMWKRKLVSC